MLAGYCAGWSLRTLLTEGLNGVPDKVEADPPKHLSSAVGQIVNFLGTLQNEWAGAQAFSSFDTYMAPFLRKDNLGYADVRQSIQELIYNLNVPSRWGTQTPFTNLTFDWTCPEDLAGEHPVIGGKEMPFVYGDLQAEMDMINKAYIEGHDRRRRQGTGVHLPHPDLQHHQGLPLGVAQRRDPLRDDGQVRAALFPELPQFRPGARHGPVHVLPPPARPARTAQARQRPVRQRRADRLRRRRDHQLRPPGLPASRRRGRAARPAGQPARHRLQKPRNQTQGNRPPHAGRPFPPTPSATSARCATTSRPSASTASTNASATSRPTPRPSPPRPATPSPCACSTTCAHA